MIYDEIVAKRRLTPAPLSKKFAHTGPDSSAAAIYQTQPDMARGTVKWFNEKKGFGFLNDPGVNGDIFVHFSVIQTNGFRTLQQGDEVEYELCEDQKGSRAKNVVRV